MVSVTHEATAVQVQARGAMQLEDLQDFVHHAYRYFEVGNDANTAREVLAQVLVKVTQAMQQANTVSVRGFRKYVYLPLEMSDVDDSNNMIMARNTHAVVKYVHDNLVDFEIDNAKAQYFVAKRYKDSGELLDALAALKAVLDLPAVDEVYTFKVHKQLVKVLLSLEDYPKVLEQYQQLLRLVTPETENFVDEWLSSILDRVSTLTDFSIRREFYAMTMKNEATNAAMGLKTTIQLARLHLEEKKFDELRDLLVELKDMCFTATGDVIDNKERYLLDIYTIQVQMYTVQDNRAGFDDVYPKTMTIHKDKRDPWVVGALQECCGKVALRDGVLDDAYDGYYSAFNIYDKESPRRVACLEYIVLVRMLQGSKLDPFNLPMVADMDVDNLKRLWNAYSSGNLEQFRVILNDQNNVALQDPSIHEHVDLLLKKVCGEQ
uniref:PCI domain-containing protein n=1 Tax=Panagrellus redivivus TaxID=6233 RepID=A0A7E4VA21_PANRE